MSQREPFSSNTYISMGYWEGSIWRAEPTVSLYPGLRIYASLPPDAVVEQHSEPPGYVPNLWTGVMTGVVTSEWKGVYGQ